MSVRVVKETNIGVYIALDGLGIPIDDGEGHFMVKYAREGNKNAIRALLNTAKAYGYEDPGFKFIPGVRPVDDEEYIVQQQRLDAGLTPDTDELGTAIENYREGLIKK